MSQVDVNVQLPLTMDDFIAYHADHLLHTTGRAGVTKELAKSVATVQLANVFGQHASNGDSMQLRKSLATTGIVPVGGTTGADATKTEDLIDELQSTELSADKYAPFFKWITKKPCKQDVLQNTTMDTYGSSDFLGFLDETATDGGVDAFDPGFTRHALPVKWLGQHGQVMRTALAVESLGMSGDPEMGNAMENSSFARLERLYKNANYHCWFGDNSKNVNEFNGVLAQVAGASTTAKTTEYNCKGNPLTQDLMLDVTQYMYDNGGTPTDVWAGMGIWTDLRKQMIASQRIEPGKSYGMGNQWDSLILADFGVQDTNAKFHRDKMLDPSPKDGTQAADTNAPAAPTSVTCTATSSTALNKWNSYLAVNGGTFYYAVSSVGVKGESIVTAGDAAVTVTGTQRGNLSIASSDANVKYFYVYRGTATNNLQLLDRIARAGATTVFADRGDVVPGCANVAFLDAHPLRKGFNSVMFRQLWPIDKIKLPTAIMSEQFVWLLAGTPQVLLNPFNFILRNVGRLPKDT